MRTKNITAERLREVLHYEVDTGVFYWKTSNSNRAKAGSRAGGLCHGYMSIRIDGKNYYAHRLAWLYVHGHFPQKGIDHIDRVKTNNLISNLREATQKQNAENQTPRVSNPIGVNGVSWYKQKKKWRARIRFNGEDIHLGMFTRIEDAVTARINAEKRMCSHSESLLPYSR